MGEAKRIAVQVEALRYEKRTPRVHLLHPERLVPHYQKHLLAELMQWIRLIGALPAGAARDTLTAVFSSGVVKFSNRSSDSRNGSDPPRYPKGSVTRYLLAKSEELTRNQMALGESLPRRIRVEIYQEDARLLPSLGWGVCRIIITRPP